MNGVSETNMKEIEAIVINELTYATLRALTQVLSNKDQDIPDAVQGIVSVILGFNRFAFLHQVADSIVNFKMRPAYTLNYDIIEDMEQRFDVRAYASYIANKLRDGEDPKDVFSHIMEARKEA